MTEYRFARPGEEEDILDFINLVFSQSHAPHSFDRLLPKVYGHDDHASLHALAIREGRIRAAVAMLPLTLQVDESHALKAGYVGSVSVHERYRSEGHMKALMEMTMERAREEGYDLLALGGQRQRYGYWDFEGGGVCITFSVTAANIRHALGPVDAGLIRIRPVTEAKDPLLPALYALSCSQQMICRRRKDRFLEIMQSWNHTLYALENAFDGSLAGYICGNSGYIAEMVLQDDEMLYPVLKAFMADKRNVQIRVPFHMTRRAEQLKAIAEGYSLSDTQRFCILNFPRVLECALAFKCSFRSLEDGRFVFEITGRGRYALAVKDGRVTVSETGDAPENTFTPRQAVQFFFTPYSGLMAEGRLLRSWLPLPLDIPSADGF